VTRFKYKEQRKQVPTRISESCFDYLSFLKDQSTVNCLVNVNFYCKQLL